MKTKSITKGSNKNNQAVSKKDKAIKTDVVYGEYNGFPTVSIVDSALYAADPSDRRAVIVSLGARKIKAILAHAAELEAWSSK